MLRRTLFLAACCFSLPVSGEPADLYRQLVYRDDVWYESTYWTGPDWTRVGKDRHHPGENTPSVGGVGQIFLAFFLGWHAFTGSGRGRHVDEHAHPALARRESMPPFNGARKICHTQ